MDSNQELAKKIEALEDRLQIATADLLAMRAAIVTFAPLISSASIAQSVALKARSLDRLTNYLLAGEMGDEMADEATISLEGLFYEIGAAKNEAGQTPPTIS